MFYRQSLDTTLTDLREVLAERGAGADPVRVSPENIEFHLDATDPTIAVKAHGARKVTEIPASVDTLTVFGDFLGVPTAFTKRMHERTTGPTQNMLLADLLRNTAQKDLAVTVNRSKSAITEIGEYDARRKLRPLDVVDTIINAFDFGKDGGSSPRVNPEVARLVDENHIFAFDAHVPFEASNFGLGGDFEQGDLTAAGVRVEVNLKQGLAPSVQPYTYRLFCTNGMETPLAGTKIDARGQTVEEVLLELEGMARIAFAQAEKDIEHFYDLRNEKVDNPERAIRSLAREQGIPDRSTLRIIDLAAGEDLPDDPSMFDIVNLVTNFANSPQVRNDGGRLILERAGGAVINDHSARCGHCRQRVTS